MPINRKREEELEEEEAEQEAEEQEAEKEKEEEGDGEEDESPMRKARKALADEDAPRRTKKAVAPDPDEELTVGTVSFEDLNEAMAQNAEAAVKKAIAPLLVHIESLVTKNTRLTKAVTLLCDGMDEISTQNVAIKKALGTGGTRPARQEVESASTPRRRSEEVEVVQKGVKTGRSAEPSEGEISADEQESVIEKAIQLRRRGVDVEGFSSEVVARWEDGGLPHEEFTALRKAVKIASE